MAAVCNYEFLLTLERNLKETTTEIKLKQNT